MKVVVEAVESFSLSLSNLTRGQVNYLQAVMQNPIGDGEDEDITALREEIFNQCKKMLSPKA